MLVKRLIIECLAKNINVNKWNFKEIYNWLKESAIKILSPIWNNLNIIVTICFLRKKLFLVYCLLIDLKLLEIKVLPLIQLLMLELSSHFSIYCIRSNLSIYFYWLWTLLLCHWYTCTLAVACNDVWLDTVYLKLPMSRLKTSKFQCGTWVHYYTRAFLPIIVYQWNKHIYIINHCHHNQKIFSANP